MATSSVPAREGEPRRNLAASRRLPRTSNRLAIPRAYCQLVTAVRREHGRFWFDGPIYAPGETIPVSGPDGGVLSPPLGPFLVLELAGPQTRRRPPEYLWILWQWDREAWQERGRALAIGSEWTLSLGPLAEDLLRAPIGLYDVRARGAQVADEALASLETRLGTEPADVRREAWSVLYGQLPGRIVEG